MSGISEPKRELIINRQPSIQMFAMGVAEGMGVNIVSIMNELKSET